MDEKVEFGQQIPRSRFLRCFCMSCKTPMRTITKELYNDHYCELCDPQIKARGSGQTRCTSPTETLEGGYILDTSVFTREMI